MKKLFAMLVAAACTLGAMATDYAGKIAVSINGEGAYSFTFFDVVNSTTRYAFLVQTVG